jgi:NADPH:quinone reductase-like Zn-dependent oxidoreductase
MERVRDELLADRVSRTPERALGLGSTMKAIVQTRYGSPDVLQLKDVDKPVVKDDEVLVRVHAAAVNIGDWHLLRGVPYIVRLVAGLRAPRHEIPGLDIAGQVEAVGGKVQQFRPGDEVFGWCRGALAEYACAAASDLLPKASNLTLKQSAAVGDSAFTALAAVRDQGKVQPGQRVLINGASGGVGTFAVQIAKAFGANVTGVCSAANIDLVRSIGADQVIDYNKGGVRPNPPAVRRDARFGREPFVIGLQARADPSGHVCCCWREGHGSLAGARTPVQGALALSVRAPADAGVRREA